MEVEGSLVTLCDVINAAVEVKGSLVALCDAQMRVIGDVPGTEI